MDNLSGPRSKTLIRSRATGRGSTTVARRSRLSSTMSPHVTPGRRSCSDAEESFWRLRPLGSGCLSLGRKIGLGVLPFRVLAYGHFTLSWRKIGVSSCIKFVGHPQLTPKRLIN